MLKADNLRMFVSVAGADWWQTEFMVINNKIVYRGTGGDQAAVYVTAGSHTINLNFKTGVSSIN